MTDEPPLPPLFSRPGLAVDIYDAWHERMLPSTPVAGDVEFFVAMSQRTGGPVLEIGSGTGRVAWSLAAAGLDVVAVEPSAAMRAICLAKANLHGAATASRVECIDGRFESLELGRTFPLIVVAIRTFAVLTDVPDQKAALRRLREHLDPGGRLVIDLFDPRLDLLLPQNDGAVSGSGAIPHPDRPTDVEARVTRVRTDPSEQVLTETFEFVERDAAGEVVASECGRLTLRWTYRHEMRHLVELCGLTVEHEFGGYHGEPPTYGAEQVWVLRRA